MRLRLLVSALGVPLIFLVTLFLPVWVLMVSLSILSGIAAWELLHCVSRGRTPPLFPITVAAASGVVWVAYFAPECLAALWLLYIMLTFVYAIVQAGKVPLLHTLAGICAVIFIPYAFCAFLRLDAAGCHRGFLLLPFIFSFCSDTGAFFVGRALGKHKLAPRVSPHKTWEGAIGGLIGNLVGSLVFAFVMNTWFKQSLGYTAMILVGLLCSLAAQLGDLSFSLIKREFGIKDYSRLFLTHGGVLDRFDSVIFVAPILAFLVPLLFL